MVWTAVFLAGCNNLGVWDYLCGHLGTIMSAWQTTGMNVIIWYPQPGQLDAFVLISGPFQDW